MFRHQHCVGREPCQAGSVCKVIGNKSRTTIVAWFWIRSAKLALVFHFFAGLVATMHAADDILSDGVACTSETSQLLGRQWQAL